MNEQQKEQYANGDGDIFRGIVGLAVFCGPFYIYENRFDQCHEQKQFDHYCIYRKQKYSRKATTDDDPEEALGSPVSAYQ